MFILSSTIIWPKNFLHKPIHSRELTISPLGGSESRMHQKPSRMPLILESEGVMSIHRKINRYNSSNWFAKKSQVRVARPIDFNFRVKNKVKYNINHTFKGKLFQEEHMQLFNNKCDQLSIPQVYKILQGIFYHDEMHQCFMKDSD